MKGGNIQTFLNGGTHRMQSLRTMERYLSTKGDETLTRLNRRERSQVIDILLTERGQATVHTP